MRVKRYSSLHLDIIYRDEELIAINKPHALLVHRSPMASNTDLFALQLLRDQLGQWVYPVHRLDRKTGGVLLFALDKEMHAALSSLFKAGKIRKEYLAILRGHTREKGSIDYPLKNDKGKIQEAFTDYYTLDKTEIPYAGEKHETQRYSLVRAIPKTGRMHQLRKHFSHIFHPIIGDRPHGCNKQNRFFKQQFAMDTMMLHASKLAFIHPSSRRKIRIMARVHPEFERMITTLGFMPVEQLSPFREQ